jgi:hypothetical protein
MGSVVLEQLAGSRKTITLDGPSAPLGRPRQGPVVTDGVEVRAATVWYPGSDAAPTRHIFGIKYEPWKLSGYLRDRNLGRGGARAKCEEIKAFVRDQQKVQVSWNDIVSGIGLVTKFSPGRESEGEIKWEMQIDIDEDAYADRKPQPIASPAPKDFAFQMALYLQLLLTNINSVPALRGSIFDLIDSAISTITAAAGELNNIASQVSSFEKASLAQLNRLSSVVTTIRGAAFTLRESFASVGPDLALWQQRASHNAELWAQQTTVEDYLRQTLANGAELDRQARIAASGKIRTTYIVQQGDTWESIAVQFYGSPERAPDLQVANDQIGGAPLAGTEIKIPV